MGDLVIWMGGLIWYCKVEIFIYYDNVGRRIHLFFNIIQKYIINK